jgi:Fe-S-cluster containining protein
MTVKAEDATPDQEKFYLLRNGVKGEDGKIRLVTHSFAPCAAHDPVKLRCTIYDDRPDVCRAFPSMPDQIEGTPCSYWFEAVDEEGSVVERRGGLGSPHPSPPRFKS